MKSALKRTSCAMAGMLPAAFLARTGLPALAALVFLAVLTLSVACWIISSDERSDRVTRMIFAKQCDARCLEKSPPASALPTSRSRRSRRPA